MPSSSAWSISTSSSMSSLVGMAACFSFFVRKKSASSSVSSHISWTSHPGWSASRHRCFISAPTPWTKCCSAQSALSRRGALVVRACSQRTFMIPASEYRCAFVSDCFCYLGRPAELYEKLSSRIGLTSVTKLHIACGGDLDLYLGVSEQPEDRHCRPRVLQCYA